MTVTGRATTVSAPSASIPVQRGARWRSAPVPGRRRSAAGDDGLGRQRSHVRTALTRFVVVGLVSFAVVSVPTALAMRSVARDHALQEAENRGLRLAAQTIAPHVDDAVLAGDPDALRVLDAVVDARMSDGSIVRVKVWDTSGKVIYSDEPHLVGRVFELEPWADELLRTGGATAELETLDDAENLYEPTGEVLVEVYAVATAASGNPLLFEAYFPGDDVRKQERDLLMRLLPLGLAALLVLLLVQLPSAIGLARRVQRGQEVRRRLLRQAVAASDLERRRIARDLHDDVIQDLAGVAYALESAESRLPDDARPLVSRARSIVRRDVASLRGMLADLYPADLDSLGLPGAVDQLAEPLRRQGVTVTVDVSDVHVDRTKATLLYRVAREAMTNTAKHAHASTVEVRLLLDDGSVVLTVSDDGAGFDTARESARGHLGMRLIRDTVAEAGGSVDVASTEGVGTWIEVRLPLG